MYNTCENGCMYCYANYNCEMARKNREQHNLMSALICGEIHDEDKVTIRKVKSHIDGQLQLF